MPVPPFKQLFHSTWKAFTTHWGVFILFPTVWMLGICGLVHKASVQIDGQSGSYADFTGLGTLFLLGLAMVIGWCFAWIYYGAAIAHWANELEKGKKKLSLTEGLKAALKGLPRNLWTGILKQASIALWSMLMVFPGVYKSITYSKALPISQLEGLHGLKALKKSAEWVGNKGVGTVGVNKYASIFIGVSVCGALMLFFSFCFSLFFPSPPATSTDPRAIGLSFLFGELLLNLLFSFLSLQNTKEYLSARS